MYYSLPGDSTAWDAPAPITALMDALLEVDLMSRKIEDEAVTAVPANLISSLSSALKSHQVRACVGGRGWQAFCSGLWARA
jgi:hypothetical protein